MASKRILAVLLASCAFTALADSPCDIQKPQPEPTEEPCTPVTDKPGLTDAQKAGIAVAAVAGAGIIAGGIACGVAASNNARRRRKDGSRRRKASANTTVPVVPVVIPVEVPGGNRLYKADDKAAVTQSDIAAKVGSNASQGMLMGAAAFVFFGCLFLGISGFIYAKTRNRSTRVIQVQQDAEALLAVEEE